MCPLWDPVVGGVCDMPGRAGRQVPAAHAPRSFAHLPGCTVAFGRFMEGRAPGSRGTGVCPLKLYRHGAGTVRGTLWLML